MTKDKIVLVPFPFDDLSAEKVRPAVCLTDPIGQHRHVILAFITSNTNQEFLETDVMLDSRELGELSPEMKKQVVEKLRKLFELN